MQKPSHAFGSFIEHKWDVLLSLTVRRSGNLSRSLEPRLFLLSSPRQRPRPFISRKNKKDSHEALRRLESRQPSMFQFAYNRGEIAWGSPRWPRNIQGHHYAHYVWRIHDNSVYTYTHALRVAKKDPERKGVCEVRSRKFREILGGARRRVTYT